VSYKVETETYQGPFDLLLQLILKDDVDLYEIKLGEIVDAYLLEISKMEKCDLEVSTEFLLIASTLIELKCRRLLPNEKDSDLDEELGLWEERDLLLARLLECKTFKDASNVVRGLFDSAKLSVPRISGLEDEYLDISPDPLAGMTSEKLRKAFLKVATAKPKPEVSLFHVNQIRVSVSETISELTRSLRGSRQIKFSSLVSPSMERIEVVVHFLAVLELFKQGLVDLDQFECFGELSISWVAEPDLTPDLVLADSYEG